MDIKNILAKLKSGNEYLDLLTKVYFLSTSRLDSPVLGNYSFKDVNNNFTYSLREYSIIHSGVIEPYENPTDEKLLKMNGIPIKTYKAFTKNVDDILKSYTDEHLSTEQKRTILKKQIEEFIGGAPDEEQEATKYKMYKSLNPNKDMFKDTLIRNRYLDNILLAMEKGEINQIDDDKYIVVSSLFKMNSELDEYLDYYKFKEKKKYLQKKKRTNPEQAIKRLIKDTQVLLNEDEHDSDNNSEPVPKRVQWFFFYLIYGKNKVDIFMIHSILGYKYDGAKELYQKVFCKDHSTGKSEDFLHHTDILNLQLDDLKNETDRIYETVLHYL